MSVFFDLGAGLGKSTQVCASLGKSAVSTGASREAPVDNDCFLIWELGWLLGAGLGKFRQVGGDGNPDAQAIGSWARQV